MSNREDDWEDLRTDQKVTPPEGFDDVHVLDRPTVETTLSAICSTALLVSKVYADERFLPADVLGYLVMTADGEYCSDALLRLIETPEWRAYETYLKEVIQGKSVNEQISGRLYGGTAKVDE